MSKLFISGFGGILGNLQSPIQAAFGLNESHEVTIGAGSLASPATETGTNLLYLLPEADCNVAVGPDPNAETDNVVALKAGIPFWLGITPGHKVAAVQRSA